MSWKKLLANKNVVREPPSKVELDNLRSIVASYPCAMIEITRFFYGLD